MNFLKTHIEQICNPDIILCKPKTKVQDLPRLHACVLSSKFDGSTGSTIGVLELLGLAKPAFTKTQVGILHLSLRKGEVVGCKLRLHKKQQNAFLESLLFEILPNISKKPKFQKNSIHLNYPDVFKTEDINNIISYLDGGAGVRSLDIVVLAKNAKCPLLFKSLGFDF